MIIELTINGLKVSARKGEYLLDVARRSGFDIPTLCHHEAVSSAGACRLCLVQIENTGRTKIATSCNYPVSGGENVQTDNARIKRLRKTVLELLLPLAPESTTLRRLARAHGLRKSRFQAAATRTDCILCGLCVRACKELAGANAIDFSSRGSKKMLSAPYGEETGACIACGACSEMCPVDSITMETLALMRLREKRGSERRCRYHFMGLAPSALCPMNYDCAHCEIDQQMRNFYGGHPLIMAALKLKKQEGGRKKE
ncbi:MAG: 2Fe-2S iron-sulfur cluster-binding protein [Pseudomonadota bacterium]